MIKNTRKIQDQFSAVSRKAASSRRIDEFVPDQQDELTRNVHQLHDHCTRLLQNHGWNPADLPIRTRRAYQWLSFLTEGSRLADHWQTLVQLWTVRGDIRIPLAYRGCSLRLELAHISPLYRIKKTGNLLLISLQESYLGAPKDILLAAWQLAFGINPQGSRQALKAYARTTSFREVREHLEYLGVAEGAFSQGRCWDLKVIFNRVNRNYFGGELEQPHLKWSRRRSFRKFGHYSFETDTVQISRSLDAGHVPGYILDYLMFHELLHKEHGLHQMGSRSYAHTPTFRQQERTYPRAEEAQAYLQEYSHRLKHAG